MASPFEGTRIADLAQLEVKLAEIAASPYGPAAHFGEFWFDMPIDPTLDPLSPAYRDAIQAHYQRVAGTDPPTPSDADPAEIGSDHALVVRTWPYSTGSGEQVGQFLQAVGFILATCRLRRGHRVLLPGIGSANLAVTLARMGCIVTVLDADRSNMAVLRHRAERAGLTLRLVHAEIDNAAAALAGQVFDFVVFHSTFHRSGDHLGLLRQIRERLLARGGRLVLAGEPLLENAPSPWGLEPTGGSIWAMRHGSGPLVMFRPSYLMQALTACGYAATPTVCPQTALGNVMVAVRTNTQS
jgi:2-polyprenyl-3-methyl-5-hydroxy-6-metoxy-1,4-benzoquinol methylase